MASLLPLKGYLNSENSRPEEACGEPSFLSTIMGSLVLCQIEVLFGAVSLCHAKVAQAGFLQGVCMWCFVYFFVFVIFPLPFLSWLKLEVGAGGSRALF